MKNFGTLKSKILVKLTEAYENKNMGEVKDILKSIKNKKFGELYLFYEDVESKYYFDDKSTAILFVEEIASGLKNKFNPMGDVSKFCDKIDAKIGKVNVEKNIVYESLDTLLQDDSLRNIAEKIIAKKNLVEHLTTKKEVVEENNDTLVENEALLNAVLVNNFNVLYDKTLSEEQKKELNNILSLTEDNLKENFTVLKEEISSKVSEMLSESLDPELKRKLDTTKNQVTQMKPTKYNLYKLQQLKEGL
jgi:hypothetical protein